MATAQRMHGCDISEFAVTLAAASNSLCELGF